MRYNCPVDQFVVRPWLIFLGNAEYIKYFGEAEMFSAQTAKQELLDKV
jgi:hypothetical protein